MILKQKTLIDVTKQLQARGRTIVFTHGTFDLLHIGHAEFLRKSKKLGDYLVMGIDCDKLVQFLKGAHKPIIPLEERLITIAELGVVDFAFPIKFPREQLEDFYRKLYLKLQPNVVTCGYNFDNYKKMRERIRPLKHTKLRKITHKYDGKESTSQLIQKIRGLPPPIPR